MSLDKWIEYVKPEIKPPYIDKIFYLTQLTKIKVEKDHSVVYIKVACRNLLKNINKDNWCSLKNIVNPECIECEYVRQSHIIRRKIRQLMKNSKIWYYEYEVIEI
jgi:hypothetical protein